MVPKNKNLKKSKDKVKDFAYDCYKIFLYFIQEPWISHVDILLNEKK